MASSILNSDDGVISGTSGLKSTGGDDGVLVFQSKGTETAQINTDKQIVAAAGTASLPVLTTTGDLNTGIYFPAADNIGFATGGTIRGRWTTDGLCFGSDTAAANALDDYEEGTFTATLKGGGADPTTPVTSTARYTKIGNMVSIYIGYDNVNTTGASGGISVTGLPFAAGSRITGSVNSYSLATWSGYLSPDIGAGGTVIDLLGVVSNSTWSSATHSAGARKIYVYCNELHSLISLSGFLNRKGNQNGIRETNSSRPH
jgi:hypothetical protein